MTEFLDPLFTAGLASIAALAGWLANGRRHLHRMHDLHASHRKQNDAALGHLAEARQQASSLQKEISMLRREIVNLQTRWHRASTPKAVVEPSVRRTAVETTVHVAGSSRQSARAGSVQRTPVETTTRWNPLEDEHGFPDTQPWEPSRH